MGTTSKRYSAEVRERALRMVRERQGEYSSQWAAIESIAGKIGCTAETLRHWVRQAEGDRGEHAGMRYLSIRYSERLAECGIHASVGSSGDSYDNALAESIIGLYKTEVIRRCGPWRSIAAVEFATLEWIDWFNNRRLLEPIGHAPSVEFEQAYYRQQRGLALAA